MSPEATYGWREEILGSTETERELETEGGKIVVL